MSAAKTKAQKIIDENPVVVFSKSYCPYCKSSKALLSEKGAKYFLMELDQVGMFHLSSHSKPFAYGSRALDPSFALPDVC
jgi:hypothetical protein